MTVHKCNYKGTVNRVSLFTVAISACPAEVPPHPRLLKKATVNLQDTLQDNHSSPPPPPVQ